MNLDLYFLTVIVTVFVLFTCLRNIFSLSSFYFLRNKVVILFVKTLFLDFVSGVECILWFETKRRVVGMIDLN